ncbi:MAG: hypothetical protein ACRC0S_01675, partial [Fusobacteriaceae bacterium]
KQMKRKIKPIILILLTTLMLLLVIVYIKDPRYFNPKLWATRSNAKDLIELRAKQEYGKEFKVLFLGRRSSPSGDWYEGEAILKEKIGTEEAREYTFLATSEIEKGLLQNGGVSYYKKLQEEEMQEYFRGEIKKIFGDKVKISHRVGYKIYNEENVMEHYLGYDGGFKKAIEKVKSDSRNSMELVQWLYIFEEEKKLDNTEEYKAKIFKYKEYLDREGLLNSMDVIVFIVNDRVLLNGYEALFRAIIRNEENRKLDESGDAYYDVSKSSKKKFIDEINKLKKKESFHNIDIKINKLKIKDYKLKGDNTLNLYNSKYIIDIKELKFVKRKSYIELNGGIND